MKKHKTLEGKVVSLKMDKTVVIETVRYVPHRLYKKLLKRSKKFKVDKGSFDLKLGDRVKVSEVKPISRSKHFKVVEVLK